MFYEAVRADSLSDLNDKVNAKLKHGFRLFGGVSSSAYVTVDPTTDLDVVHESFMQALVKDDGATPIIREARDHIHQVR